MSMVIGILPIVGLPLPLVSYGGSSMWTYFIGWVNFVTKIRNRQKILVNTFLLKILQFFCIFSYLKL